MGMLRGVLAWALILSAAELPELLRVDTANFLPVVRAQIDRAEAAARAHPRDVNDTGALAMTLHAYQQYEAAEQAYSRVLVLDPQNFDWLYLIGAVQMAQGTFDAAVKSFQAALRLRPNDLTSRLRLAESFAAAAAWDEAANEYRRIADEHHDFPQAWYGLGRVQAAQGDHAAAAASYARACELFPPYGAAHFAMAAELRKLGKSAEAEQHLAQYSKNATAEPPLDDPLFARIHELNHSTTAHLQRGAELEKEGKLQEAIAEHEAALATDPNNVQVHVNLIGLYGRSGNAAKAKENFEAATRLSTGRSDAWYDYGVLLFGEHDYTGAERAYRRALDINPSYAEAHNNLGAIYEQQNRLDDAEREFREAITARPDYPLARFHLGRILVNRQRYGEAIQQFNRALQPESDQTPVYLYALAATYVRAGDRQNALKYYARAREGAVARGQSQLLTSIDRDLKLLEQ